MKLATKWVVVAASCVLVATGGVAWWLQRGLPTVEGSLRVSGIKARIAVTRDDFGIPLIAAENDEDGYFALGYIHAQDRLWQMEIQRRVGAGRLAEIMGERALPTDRFMRTLGIYRLAEQSVEHLRPEVRRALEAYAAGVNTYLARHSLPTEFVLLRFTPEPWKPADSLVWGRLMALQLAGNWPDELLRAKLLKVLPADQVNDLWRSGGKGDPTTIGLEETFLDRLLAAIPAAIKPHLASNVWVVSGARSKTGKPILANDPHLGFQAPILWYLASISTPNLDLAGGTIPGVPFHLLGHNDRIAWGFTTTQSDTMDLFIEQPAGDGYLTPDGPAPFRVRNETIKVRRGADVTLSVRETRHGPVISDVLGERAQGQLLALSATALDPDDVTPQALYRLNRAKNWQEFNQALEDFHAPQQNIAYADVRGHIGLVSPGHVPIRKAGDGTLPRPGWTGEYDWTGWVPFDALPRVFDPPSGIIANANNQVVPDNYPYLLTADWPEAYRAERILDRLKATEQHDVADMARLQMDQVSLMAADLMPLLLKTPPRDARAAKVHDMLAAWNHETDANRPEPLIFEAWLTHLQRSLLQPWLGTQADSFAALKPFFLKAVLNGRTVWCSPPGQPTPNSCDKAVTDALDAALDDLSKRFGSEPSQWRWGNAHMATFEALFYRYIPLLDNLTRLSVSTGGDDFTVQRGSFADPDPNVFRQFHGAGLRAVYDLSDLQGSRFIIATGQSGSPLSSHWGDMLEKWRNGDSVSLPPRTEGSHALSLEPEETER